jgi:hypothetical protein
MTPKQTAPEVPAPATAPSPLNLYQRWRNVLADIESIEKSGRNKDQNYTFMRSADVLLTLRALFAKHGLVLKANPNVANVDDSEYTTKNGAHMHCVRLEMHYELINVDVPDDRCELIGIGDAADSSDKAINKSRTSALKFTLRDNFLIDDQESAKIDADNATHERESRQQRFDRSERKDEVSRRFAGVITDCSEGGGKSEQRFKWILLNNVAERLYSFDEDRFDELMPGKRIAAVCTQRAGKQGRPFWVIREVTAEQPLTPQPPETPVGTIGSILQRLFPNGKETARRRLVEEALKDSPPSFHLPILQSFERRMLAERPSSELGVLALLDIAKEEAVNMEEAGNGNY